MIITATLKNGIRFLSLSILSLFGWAGMLNPVQALCTFTKTGGEIVKSSTGLKALEASSGLFGGTDGSTGTVVLDCTNGALISIGQPNRTSAPASFTPTISHALVKYLGPPKREMFVSNGGGQFTHAPWAGRSTAPFNIPKGIQNLSIGMIVGENNHGFLPSGSYSYTTVLTVIPN